MHWSSVIPGAVCSVNSGSGWVNSGSGSDSASDSSDSLSSSCRSTNGGFCLVSHLFLHQKMLSPTDSKVSLKVSQGVLSCIGNHLLMNFCPLLLSWWCFCWKRDLSFLYSMFSIFVDLIWTSFAQLPQQSPELFGEHLWRWAMLHHHWSLLIIFLYLIPFPPDLSLTLTPDQPCHHHC